MTGPMSGTADPYWQRLSDLVVQGSVASQHADELKEVFTLDGNLDKWQGRVPSYLLSGVSHPHFSPHSSFHLFFSVLFFPFFLALPCLSPSLFCILRFTLLACVPFFLTSWRLTSSPSSSSSSSQPHQRDLLLCSFDQGAELLRAGSACQGRLRRLRLQSSAQPCLSSNRQP